MNRPTDSVRIVIFDADDPAKFLVLAEADDPTNWKLAGGKFDSVDETPEAAAGRELAEELRFAAGGISLWAVGQLKNDDGVSARHIFAAQVHASQLASSEEIAAVQWCAEADVPEMPNKTHI